MSDQGPAPPGCHRRHVLRLLAGSGLLVGTGGLSACRGPGDDTPSVRLPLSRVPVGERVRVVVAGDPVELLRRNGEVRARSLLCTHFGCEIHWSADEERYVCPCHGGRFDPRGNPVAGPPARPLPTLSARISDGRVVIEPPTTGGSR